MKSGALLLILFVSLPALANSKIDSKVKAATALSKQAMLIKTRKEAELASQKAAQTKKQEEETQIEIELHRTLETLVQMPPDARHEFIENQVNFLADVLNSTVGEGSLRTQDATLLTSEEGREAAESFMELVKLISRKYEMQGSRSPVKSAKKLTRAVVGTYATGMLGPMGSMVLMVAGIVSPPVAAIMAGIAAVPAVGGIVLGDFMKSAQQRVRYLSVLDEIRTEVLNNPRLALLVGKEELLPESAASCWKILTAPSLLNVPQLKSGS